MSKQPTPMTNILIFINVFIMFIVFVSNYVSHTQFTIELDTLMSFGAIEPHKSSFLTTLSSMFLHAGIIHLTINMISLKFLGKDMEPVFGKMFLPIYLFFGVGASFIYYYLGSNPAVGASAAICGLLSAKLVYSFKINLSMKDKLGSVLDVIIILAIGFVPNISAIGHAAGLVIGFIFSLIYFELTVKNKKITDESLNDTPQIIIADSYRVR